MKLQELENSVKNPCTGAHFSKNSKNYAPWVTLTFCFTLRVPGRLSDALADGSSSLWFMSSHTVNPETTPFSHNVGWGQDEVLCLLYLLSPLCVLPLCLPESHPDHWDRGSFSTVMPRIMLCEGSHLGRGEVWVLRVLTTKGAQDRGPVAVLLRWSQAWVAQT